MEMDCTDLVQHDIDTGGHAPLKQPPRRIPLSLRATGHRRCWIVELLSTHQFHGPAHCIGVQIGWVYQILCVNYHHLNAITKLDKFPLPHVDDSLDLLAGMKYVFHHGRFSHRLLASYYICHLKPKKSLHL